MRHRSLLAAAALLGGLLAPVRGADAGLGFFLQQNLNPVAGTPEPGARGGFTSWFRTRNDRSTVQGLKVWVQGLTLAEGAKLWMSLPGEAETQEVASLAWSPRETGDGDPAGGSGVYEVVIDSARDDGAAVPLGAESVLKLFYGFVEIRVAGADLADVPILRARVGKFHFEEIELGGPGRTADLRRSPDPAQVVDDLARGSVRIWRRKERGVVQQGVSLSARGLTEDGDYEVWIEDEDGSLAEVGALTATAEGQGYWSLDTRYGDTLPSEIGVDSIRDLARRRVELRRAGGDGYSLAGLFPR